MSLDRPAIPVMQGQHVVSRDPAAVLSSVLGSCVAACMHDPVLSFGGMNHFLLPGGDPSSRSNLKYGLHLMEELINGMLRRGSVRSNLTVQLYGGANVIRASAEIGESNAQFARTFVRNEGLKLIREDLGGTQGRRIRFHPTTGHTMVTTYASTRETDPAPERPRRRQRDGINAGKVELF